MGVVVYSTQACPYCVMAKNFLKQKGVEFDEVDVGQDRKAAEEMFAKSGELGVPQIEVNGKIIVGFDKQAIESELAKSGSG